jgi:ATP:corrinoid adenosyltransferase
MSEERHQQRQQRLKEQVDARVAAAQDERGIVIVFTGNGKGKPPPHLAPRHAPSATVKKSA